MQLVRIARRVDWILFLSAGVLALLGILAIWSVDLAQDPDHFFNLKKQLLFVAAGIGITLGTTLIDFRVFRSMSRPLYLFGLALLFGVLVVGTTIRGTRGWFTFGSLTFQPVEIAKVILILVLAKYLSLRAHVVNFKVLVNFWILAGLYIVLTLLQPDFGSALVLIAISTGMFLFTNVPKRYLVIGAGTVLVIGVAAWFFFLKPYQKDRLLSFVSPEADPFGRGYNIRQSVIAVGSGGIFGRGLGEGSQSQLRFLPEAQTDFIFAVLAEQLGFVVVLVILASYGLMVWRLLHIVRTTGDGFALFVVVGFFIVVMIQTIFNIGMNLGMLPIVGLPLPFVSSGGSALLGNFLMLGVVQSIRARG